MPFSIDDLTRKKLALLKQLYQRGVLQSSSEYSTVNRILSVIVFDLAIENALRTVISTLNTSIRVDDDRTFPKLVQQAKYELQDADLGPIPYESEIKHVHKVRNDAQHNSRYPSEIEVSDSRTYARDFLRKIVWQVWGCSFDSISLVDFVNNQKAREFLARSEAALAQDDYEQCVSNANAGLSWTISKVPRLLIGDSLRLSFWDYTATRYRVTYDSIGPLGRIPDSDTNLWNLAVGMRKEVFSEFERVYGALDEMRRDLAREFGVVRDTFVYFTLGMNHADFLRFRQFAGTVHFYRDQDDELRFNIDNMKQNLSRSDAEFAFAYCTDAVIQIESRVGDIDTPSV